MKPWLAGQTPVSSIKAEQWTTHEWLHMLNVLPADLGADKLGQLDAAFHLTRTGNSEILSKWLELAIGNGYEAAYPRVSEFLTSQGRRKFLRPLYKALAQTPEGKKRAESIYKRARPTYHPISVSSIDEILGVPGG